MTTPKSTNAGKGAKAGDDSEARHDVDRVAMASRAADGTPDQTPWFEYIDPEVAVEATTEQLAAQRSSAIDQEVRAEPGEPLDTEGQEKLAKAQEAATASARKDAEAEVNAHT